MSYVKLHNKSGVLLFESFAPGQEYRLSTRLEALWSLYPDAIAGIYGAATAELSGLPQVGDVAADVDVKSFSGPQELLLGRLATFGEMPLPLEQLKTAKSLEKQGYVAMDGTHTRITWAGRNALSMFRRLARVNEVARKSGVAELEGAE
jgi:hypothetical protein